jgi:hypothetical protein
VAGPESGSTETRVPDSDHFGKSGTPTVTCNNLDGPIGDRPSHPVVSSMRGSLPALPARTAGHLTTGTTVLVAEGRSATTDTASTITVSEWHSAAGIRAHTWRRTGCTGRARKCERTRTIRSSLCTCTCTVHMYVAPRCCCLHTGTLCTGSSYCCARSAAALVTLGLLPAVLADATVSALFSYNQLVMALQNAMVSWVSRTPLHSRTLRKTPRKSCMHATTELARRLQGLPQSFSLRVSPSTIANSGAGLFVEGTIAAGAASHRQHERRTEVPSEIPTVRPTE